MFPLFDNNEHKHLPVVTVALIMANVTIFGYQLHLHRMDLLQPFIAQYALIPIRLFHAPGENAATIFTSMFLHGGLLHLLANIWFLWLFGKSVEDRAGPARFAIIYAVAGVGAAFAQFIISPLSRIPMIGASGAIAGILGAYLVLFPRAVIFTFVPWIIPIIPAPAVIFLLLWFMFQIWHGLMALGMPQTGGVAWWAHFGGFVAGLMVIRSIGPRKRRQGYL